MWATIIQKGNNSLPGHQFNNHPAKLGSLISTVITRDVKKQAKTWIFRAARTIVEEIMVENCDLREPGASRTDPGLLSRVANSLQRTSLKQDSSRKMFGCRTGGIWCLPHRAAVGGPCQRQTVVCRWDLQTRQEAICSTDVHSCLHQKRRPHQTSSLRICPDVRETWEGLQKGHLIAVFQTIVKCLPSPLL